MDYRLDTDLTNMSTIAPTREHVVHLELHTRDAARAKAFYEQLVCWRARRFPAAAHAYLSLDLGGQLGGGIVECRTRRALWLPYVEVDSVHDVTQRARRLGSTVLLEPREGSAGWRSVVSSPEGGEVAFWQPKL
jgi:predicted enzyme related to lactoylglutathione lyase